MNTVRVFAEGVAEQISNYLPEEFQNMEFTVVENTKNNGVVLTGLNVHIPGENISPVIYMNEFYNEIKKGEPMNETMERIASCIEHCRHNDMMNLNIELHDIDMFKDRITPMLINAKANREMLQNMPHIQVEDLAMIFKVDMELPGEGNHGMIKINNEMLENWNMTLGEVCEKAITNIQKYDEPILIPMGEMVFEIVNGGKASINLLENHQVFSRFSDEMMFVLTNKSRYHGTSALVCPEVMNRINELMPNGFYILPSSVHETIIVSKECGMGGKELGQMVREVNRDMVSREEVLSDRVYEYDKELGKICQVSESIQKSREATR